MNACKCIDTPAVAGQETRQLINWSGCTNAGTATLSNKLFRFIIIIQLVLITMSVSCKKLIEISPPNNSITTSKTFKDSLNANAAISGIYEKLISGTGVSFGNGALTLLCGLYSDEFNIIIDPADELNYWRSSLLTPYTGPELDKIWTDAYYCIYQANACIEGLTNNEQLSKAVKDQFLGEALFLRSWAYFQICNLFGDLPFITSTDWTKTQNVSKTEINDIYQAILMDLKNAKGMMTYGYTINKGERIRASTWAASALLSKIYLHLNMWQEAEAEATSIIENNLFQLNQDINQVFLKNSSEAILQWHINSAISTLSNLTPEGFNLIPHPARGPRTYLSEKLLNDFEPGDERRIKWVDSLLYLGAYYYYPYKYKNGPRQYGGPVTEYYMILRLGEQYLIRAEARAHQNKIPDSYADLNRIRERAKLPPLASQSKSELLQSIMKEKRIELAYESGNRFFDLKRTKALDIELANIKPQWQNFRKNLPIPIVEIQRNPSLIQNDGY